MDCCLSPAYFGCHQENAVQHRDTALVEINSLKQCSLKGKEKRETEESSK